MRIATLCLATQVDALNLARRTRLAQGEEPQGMPSRELCAECKYDGVLGPRRTRCAWCGALGRKRV